MTYAEGLSWEKISFCSNKAEKEGCEKFRNSRDRGTEDCWIDERGRSGKGRGDR